VRTSRGGARAADVPPAVISFYDLLRELVRALSTICARIFVRVRLAELVNGRSSDGSKAAAPLLEHHDPAASRNHDI
jgi:hypothetical protein